MNVEAMAKRNDVIRKWQKREANADEAQAVPAASLFVDDYGNVRVKAATTNKELDKATTVTTTTHSNLLTVDEVEKKRQLFYSFTFLISTNIFSFFFLS